MSKPTILIIGGTGAQGSAVIEYLSSTASYNILALTRNVESPRAQSLANLENVIVIPSNSTHAFDLPTYAAAAAKSDYVFVNTDGFALGEAAETYWGVKLIQEAERMGVKHVIYSGLETGLAIKAVQDGLVDEEGAKDLYVGHFEGKARVQGWLHGQVRQQELHAKSTAPQRKGMTWTILRSGPYIDMLYEGLDPATADDGETRHFTLPIGPNGAVPWQALGDYGKYVHWSIQNREGEAKYADIGIGIAHATGDELASAFTKVTGTKAKYINIPIEMWGEKALGNNPAWPHGKDTRVGWQGMKDQGQGADGDGVTGQTVGENFANWWRVYQNCRAGGKEGLIVKDYELLDRLVPDRVKSVEQWIRESGWKGEKRGVLKRNDKA